MGSDTAPGCIWDSSLGRGPGQSQARQQVCWWAWLNRLRLWGAGAGALLPMLPVAGQGLVDLGGGLECGPGQWAGWRSPKGAGMDSKGWEGPQGLDTPKHQIKIRDSLCLLLYLPSGSRMLKTITHILITNL